MATSGTIGSTTLDITTAIEHAFRRASVDSSKITGEQQLAARDNLFLILSDLANDGVNLWCVQNTLLALTVGQAAYSLPVGTVDLLRAFIRAMIYPSSTPFSTTTTLGQNFLSGASAVTTVGVTASASGTQNLTVEYSNGGAYTSLYQIPAFTSVAGQQYWFDLPVVTSGSSWEIVETVNPTIQANAVAFGTTPSNILMAKLTRDQYFYLPNPTTPGKPLQYWYDKQINPVIHVWQVPNDATMLISTVLHMHVQDPGAFTNTIAAPQRWLNHIIWELASYCANERPKEERDKDVIAFCEGKAKMTRTRAEMGESDGAPLQIAPNLRAYTS